MKEGKGDHLNECVILKAKVLRLTFANEPLKNCQNIWLKSESLSLLKDRAMNLSLLDPCDNRNMQAGTQYCQDIYEPYSEQLHSFFI